MSTTEILVSSDPSEKVTPYDDLGWTGKVMKFRIYGSYHPNGKARMNKDCQICQKRRSIKKGQPFLMLFNTTDRCAHEKCVKEAIAKFSPEQKSELKRLLELAGKSKSSPKDESKPPVRAKITSGDHFVGNLDKAGPGVIKTNLTATAEDILLAIPDDIDAEIAMLRDRIDKLSRRLVVLLAFKQVQDKTLSANIPSTKGKHKEAIAIGS